MTERAADNPFVPSQPYYPADILNSLVDVKPMPECTKTIGLCRNGRDYSLGKTRLASDTETGLGLLLKLHEEVGEVTRAPRDITEYADVLQVLMDLAKHNGLSWLDVLRERELKSDESGTFLPAWLWTRVEEAE